MTPDRSSPREALEVDELIQVIGTEDAEEEDDRGGGGVGDGTIDHSKHSRRKTSCMSMIRSFYKTHRTQLRRVALAIGAMALADAVLLALMYLLIPPLPVPGKAWFLSPERDFWRELTRTALSLILCNTTECPTEEEYAIDLRPMIFWPVLLVQGYAYVAYVTEGRSNPFGSRRDPQSVWNFVTLCFTPRWFSLYSSDDQSYGSSRNKEWFMWFPTFLLAPMITLANTAPFTSMDNLLYYMLNNFLGMAMGYIIGLQFTYLDKVEWFRFFDYIVNSTMWHRLTKWDMIAFVCTMIPVTIFILLNAAVFALESWVYLLAILVVIIAINGLVLLVFGISHMLFLFQRRRKRGVPQWSLRPRPLKLHVHHYLLMGLCIPFFRLYTWRNPMSLWSFGLVTGIYVEGVARWGMDPILTPTT